MNGFLIFDISNDIVFKTLNSALFKKINEIGAFQELLPRDLTEIELDNDVLIQIFSPIINSQRIMLCQFDNTYASMQCVKGLNFAFNEFLGFLCLKIGEKSVHVLHRDLCVYISFAKRVCGADLSILKGANTKSAILLDLIKTWDEACADDQGLLLGAVERLHVGFDLRIITSKILESVTEQIKADLQSLKNHAVLFVGSKLLNSYSSRQAAKISPSDMLFLSILCTSFHTKVKQNSINSFLLFLQGTTSLGFSESIPYVVYVSVFQPGVSLILLIEHPAAQIAGSIYDVFFALQKIQNMQMQGDIENLRTYFDKLEFFTRQTLEALKKSKHEWQEVELSTKKLSSKWELLKKKYVEFFKSAEMDAVVKIESNIPAFIEELKDLLKVFCGESNNWEYHHEKINSISSYVEEKLLEFTEFLCVKAQRNSFSSSYLEDFPGLVHFIYVDRAIGFLTAPGIENDNKLIAKQKIWDMVQISRSYITKGHTAFIWKDTTFNYSYFVWFEDPNGTTIRPRDFPSNICSNVLGKSQTEAGSLSEDFYQRLCAEYVLKSPTNSIKCYELYCVHLGLVTSTCVLEHSRRLAATISDVTNFPEAF